MEEQHGVVRSNEKNVCGPRIHSSGIINEESCDKPYSSSDHCTGELSPEKNLEVDEQSKEGYQYRDTSDKSDEVHNDSASLSDRKQSLPAAKGDGHEPPGSTQRKFHRFMSVDHHDGLKVDGQWLLRRHETIFDYEYKYRADTLPYPSVKPNFVNVYHMIILVGLPARGKTYIARKLCRYLNWCSIPSKVVNLGEYRRQLAGTDRLHDFFRADNQEAQRLRHQCLVNALNDAKKWLSRNNRVVILDATNTTRERRKFVYEHCAANHLKPFFIESYCDDEDIVEANIKDVKIFSPDYIHVDKNEALEDFKKRIAHYESVYETIAENCEEERFYSYIKIFNAGQQYLVNRVDGYLQSQVVYYLMNIHITKRSLYLTTHGECEHNVGMEIGGSTGLSESGRKFALALKNFMATENVKDLKVWHSSLPGAVETASYFEEERREKWRALDYLDCGECHGMKFSELAQKFPGIFTNSKGPLEFTWRYPGGESYKDMVSRLEPVIMELERQHNILVVSHRTTMRCLMAYFLDHNPDEATHMKVPLHTLFKLTPVAYGCRVEKMTLNDDGVLT